MSYPSSSHSRPSQLDGSLLLAVPSLKEKIFDKSVILITEHNKGGATGFVLNRPSNQTIGDVITDPILKKLSHMPIYIGGPVNQSQMSLMSFYWNSKDGVLEYEAGISVHRALEMYQEGWLVRAFAGYSGWAPNQLEEELNRQTWFLRSPSALIAEDSASSDLWTEMLSGMGPMYHMIAMAPEYPERN